MRPFVDSALAEPLRCPSLRVAHLIDVHLTFISNALEELTIDMKRMRPTRIPLQTLQRTLLSRHAEQVKTLRLLNAFRQDFIRSGADPTVLSRIRHLEIAGEFGEAYQFFTRYSPTSDIQTLKLDISFDPACDIADFLDRIREPSLYLYPKNILTVYSFCETPLQQVLHFHARRSHRRPRHPSGACLERRWEHIASHRTCLPESTGRH